MSELAALLEEGNPRRAFDLPVALPLGREAARRARARFGPGRVTALRTCSFLIAAVASLGLLRRP
ncbi:MAG TPA: hypothetical protein VMG32_12970 [Anaeromyxobacteraceae bacterium]|nr:hypothetical protein [Anaeromyxobacteraceae bacterium]